MDDGHQQKKRKVDEDTPSADPPEPVHIWEVVEAVYNLDHSAAPNSATIRTTHYATRDLAMQHVRVLQIEYLQTDVTGDAGAFAETGSTAFQKVCRDLLQLEEKPDYDYDPEHPIYEQLASALADMDNKAIDALFVYAVYRHYDNFPVRSVRWSERDLHATPKDALAWI